MDCEILYLEGRLPYKDAFKFLISKPNIYIVGT